jgi:hypothetical protein
LPPARSLQWTIEIVAELLIHSVDGSPSCRRPALGRSFHA